MRHHELRQLVFGGLAGACIAGIACTTPGTPPPAAPAATAVSSEPPQTAEQQIAEGQRLYGKYCANCHGAGGEGDQDVPAVVGKGALPLDPVPSMKYRKVQFRTAADVGQWVMKNMPGKAPGSLAPAEYLAILAFDLKANGVALTEPLTLESAAKIVLHP